MIGRLLQLRSVALPLLFYVLVSQLAQTLLYTIVAYIVSLSNKAGPDFSNTVNEISSQYILFAIALGAALLTLTIFQADRALYRTLPFWNDDHRAPWELDRIRKDEFLRGLSSGALAALSYILFFTIAGQLGYLGVYITSTIGTPVFPLFFVDLFALGGLLLCEEFLFRHKILRGLTAFMPDSAAITLTSALHVLVRHWQFQLEPFDYVNLFCLNLALGYFYVKSGKCQRGLGFLMALLFLLHSFGGLPLWGYESPSFFLFKAISRSSTLFTGGAAGPLAGAGMFGILLLLAFGSYLTWKRELEARRQAERRSQP
ncbi:MAG TPA: CPBP family glutamic-type intramembrane protease [Bdellovibrionota bacterium]